MTVQPTTIGFVRDLINSHALARCVHVVAELGVADALQDEPATAAQLASRIGANADALNRILRLLAAHDVFAFGPRGYAHTEASRLLKSDHPQSLRSLGRMIGMPVIWNGFTELGEVARSGVPALDWAGLLSRLLRSIPKKPACSTRPWSASPARSFRPCSTREQLRAVCDDRRHRRRPRPPATSDSAAHPGGVGVLFDLPHVIADAAGAATNRLRLAAGDFFSDPLPVADAYVLMEVIHDWADEKAIDILTAVRRVAPSHARVAHRVARHRLAGPSFQQDARHHHARHHGRS